MFGSGNEPTIEEFNKLYPLYYDYNGGELRNITASAIETTGFNQFNGTVANVIAGKEYYVGGTYTSLAYSDETAITLTDRKFTAAKNDTITITGSSTDTIVNISDPTKNGTYESYKHHIVYFNGEEGSITTLTGKPEGSVLSEVIFPEGMKSAGTIYDELTGLKNGYFTKAIKRIGEVNLGIGNYVYNDSYNCFYNGYILPSGKEAVNNNICVKYTKSEKGNTWQLDNLCVRTGVRAIGIRDDSFNNDAAAFKTAMAGVPLYYELVNPITYTLDTPVPATYAVYNSGIEKRLPEDTASVVNAPIRYSVRYAMEAADAIRNLPINYISKESMNAFLTVLNTATNGTWSMVYNSELGRYGFTFVSNENTPESTDNTNDIIEPTETV